MAKKVSQQERRAFLRYLGDHEGQDSEAFVKHLHGLPGRVYTLKLFLHRMMKVLQQLFIPEVNASLLANSASGGVGGVVTGKTAPPSTSGKTVAVEIQRKNCK